MLINGTTLNRLYQNLSKAFDGAYNSWENIYPRYTMTAPSTTRSNLYAWLGQMPQVREWIGERQANSIGTRSYELVNRDWENTFEIDRNDVEDNTFFSFSTVAAQLGESFKQHGDVLMAATVEAGISTACFDGQFFFDTDHPVNPDKPAGTTYDNDRTLALTFANYDTVRTGFLGFKNENGIPLAPPSKLMLLVPPALELTARQIVESEWITPGTAYALAGTSGASMNPFKGSAEVCVNPYLTDTTRWYLINSGATIKPFLMQTRQAPKFVAYDRPEDPAVFAKKKFLYGTDARYAAGYTFPFLAITSKP
jgi:phage major head subunit gpT-like protein